MTAPQQPHDPDAPLLSEEEEREVTALLADLEDRGPVTTPPEVAARLDDVLAGLVAERTVPDSGSRDGRTVLPLERRARPRRWARGLLAAAAVVVVGYGAVQVVSNGSIGAGSSGGAASSAGGESADSSGSGDTDTQTLGKVGASAGDSAGSSAGNTGSGLAGGGSAMTLVPTVRADHLAGDVRRVVRVFGARTASGTSTPSAESSPGTVEEPPACPVPRLTEGQRLYDVRFRGRPAGLVVGAPQQGSVDVTLYACSDGGVLLRRAVTAP